MSLSSLFYYGGSAIVRNASKLFMKTEVCCKGCLPSGGTSPASSGPKEASCLLLDRVLFIVKMEAVKYPETQVNLTSNDPGFNIVAERELQIHNS
jgi:hypothetical protein